MSRPSDTEALARRAPSVGYRQKQEWEFPSSLRPDQRMGANGPSRNPSVGDECLSGAMKELARSAKSRT